MVKRMYRDIITDKLINKHNPIFHLNIQSMSSKEKKEPQNKLGITDAVLHEQYAWWSAVLTGSFIGPGMALSLLYMALFNLLSHNYLHSVTLDFVDRSFLIQGIFRIFVGFKVLIIDTSVSLYHVGAVYVI